MRVRCKESQWTIAKSIKRTTRRPGHAGARFVCSHAQWRSPRPEIRRLRRASAKGKAETPAFMKPCKTHHRRRRPQTGCRRRSSSPKPAPSARANSQPDRCRRFLPHKPVPFPAVVHGVSLGYPTRARLPEKHFLESTVSRQRQARQGGRSVRSRRTSTGKPMLVGAACSPPKITRCAGDGRA